MAGGQGRGAEAGEGVWGDVAVLGTTPAEAGAQLGEVGNCMQRFVTATLPIGPRPTPGWMSSRENKDAVDKLYRHPDESQDPEPLAERR